MVAAAAGCAAAAACACAAIWAPQETYCVDLLSLAAVSS